MTGEVSTIQRTLNLPMVIPQKPESTPSDKPPATPTETFQSGHVCTLADREQIIGILHRSVNLQEDSKFVGATGSGIGAITGVLLSEGVSPLLGVPVGVGLAAAAIYFAVKGWQEAGRLNQQAAELNAQLNCFTPQELNDIYHSIP